MTDANLIEIFCILDEFCKYFVPELKNARWYLRQTPPQPSLSYVRQRGDDNSCTLPYHAPLRP